MPLLDLDFLFDSPARIKRGLEDSFESVRLAPRVQFSPRHWYILNYIGKSFDADSVDYSVIDIVRYLGAVPHHVMRSEESESAEFCFSVPYAHTCRNSFSELFYSFRHCFSPKNIDTE